MKLVSRSSRLGITVRCLRILCNGLCTVRRFHSEGDEQTCRDGCPHEPESLLLQRMPSLAQDVFLFLDMLLYLHGEDG